MLDNRDTFIKSQEVNNFGTFDKDKIKATNKSPLINPFQRDPEAESVNSKESINPNCSGSIFDNPDAKEEIVSNMSKSNISENVFFDFEGKSMKEKFSRGNNSMNCGPMKSKSHQEVSYSVDYFNMTNFLKQKKATIGEFYKHFLLTQREYVKFSHTLKRTLRWLMKGVRQSNMRSTNLRKSLIEKNLPLANEVRQKSDRVDLNLQVIINRSKDASLIKNRYLIKGHIAESTFSNTFKVSRLIIVKRIIFVE